MPTECPMAVAFTTGGAPRLLYCGKWACRICAVRNSKKWAAIGRHGIKQHPNKREKPVFWTLTIHPRIKTVKDAYEVIPKQWDAFRKAIQRNQGAFKYLAFVEGQPERSNMPHFHIIAYAEIPDDWRVRKDPTKWIKDFAAHFGWGFEAYEEVITSRRAAAYIAKYASKGTPDIPKNFRRVRCSQSWQKPEQPDTDAYIVRSIGEALQDYLIRVQQACGRSLDDILEVYQKASTQLKLERRIRQ